jgi:hypothetical protein
VKLDPADWCELYEVRVKCSDLVGAAIFMRAMAGLRQDLANVPFASQDACAGW